MKREKAERMKAFRKAFSLVRQINQMDAPQNIKLLLIRRILAPHLNEIILNDVVRNITQHTNRLSDMILGYFPQQQQTISSIGVQSHVRFSKFGQSRK